MRDIGNWSTPFASGTLGPILEALGKRGDVFEVGVKLIWRELGSYIVNRVGVVDDDIKSNS